MEKDEYSEQSKRRADEMREKWQYRKKTKRGVGGISEIEESTWKKGELQRRQAPILYNNTTRVPHFDLRLL
ncbi:hypothetical protein CDAR_404931 [Caerostris darwini]|uniref:Uncharacterized protein n=1 Tax=Caerostris darwini TaxID=1538125 RepID=A0AAV4U6L1_9ARAC|nr:hypothetical protein CDAR_404931 [Caerostris darwini]